MAVSREEPSYRKDDLEQNFNRECCSPFCLGKTSWNLSICSICFSLAQAYRKKMKRRIRENDSRFNSRWSWNQPCLNTRYMYRMCESPIPWFIIICTGLVFFNKYICVLIVLHLWNKNCKCYFECIHIYIYVYVCIEHKLKL